MATEAAVRQGTSYQKQLLYSRYAHGDLGLDQVVKEVASVQPPSKAMSTARQLARFLVTLLVALALPQWSKKDN